MKNSIGLKLFIGIILFALIIVVVSWIMNVNFLEKYYINQKIDTLNSYSEEVKHAFFDKDYHKIEKIEASINGDISIYEIYDKKIVPLYVNNGMENGKGLFKGGIPLNSKELEKVFNGLTIRSIYKHPRFNTDFLYITKLIEKNTLLFVMIPLATITESVKIANKFYLYIGIISLIIGSGVALLFSKIFTKPIIKLNSIAKDMSNLDFSKKYEVTTSDEIGQLGSSINKLSKNLDRTINQLNKANEKLQLDIKRKNKIDNMRKEFISNISHELKTPLSLIKGYTEGLFDNVSKSENDKEYYLSVIIDETDKMDKLVRELLELSKLESGQVELNKEIFNIKNLLLDIEKKYKHIINEKGINFILNIYDCDVYGDISKIEQVINNFINNAIDHLEYEKNIEIYMKDNEKNIRIYLKNSGKNIPNNEIDKIWDSFYKIDKSRSREYGGTGLGLSIVKGILNLHNSNFGILNGEKYVSFWFELGKK